jgi:hypothetical protein
MLNVLSYIFMNNLKKSSLDLPKPPKIIILTASNNNERYILCVPIFIKFWLLFQSKNYNLEPRVVIVADRIPDELLIYSRYLILESNFEPYDSALVAQTIRLLLPSKLNADHVLISDVDMLPLSRRILDNCLAAVNAEVDFIIYRDVLAENEIPMCYNFGSPSAWHSLIYGDESHNDHLEILGKELNLRGGHNAYSGYHGGRGWTIDQELLWKKKHANDELCFITFKDGDVTFHRLDRVSRIRIVKWLMAPLAFFNFFDDYHMHLAVINYSRYIKFLYRIIWLREKMNTLMLPHALFYKRMRKK